jgi:sugar phosphate isomerase/epimerase
MASFADQVPLSQNRHEMSATRFLAQQCKVAACRSERKPRGSQVRTLQANWNRAVVAGDPAVETLPRIEKFVKEYDIRIAIHNHSPEDKLWPSPLEVLKAVKNMDPRMGCCIDVGHTVRTGTDVVQAIREAGPRLFDIHMKDLADFKNKESQVAVGEGLMPVREMFAALIAMRYQSFVDLEYEIHPEDPMPGVISSFAYMRGVLAGMGYAQKRAA